MGMYSCADVPTPAMPPPVPPPKNVETAPDGRIFRMRVLTKSAKYAAPSAPTRTPYGKLNAAAVPTPFANDGLPVPATVVTRPVGETLRTRWFICSATKTLRDTGSTETPTGA